MRREAKAKKATNAKAMTDALLRRRLEQAKQYQVYTNTQPSANSGECSQEEHPNGDVSEDGGVPAQQDKDLGLPSQLYKDKGSHDKLPAYRSAVPNRTKESQERKKAR